MSKKHQKPWMKVAGPYDPIEREAERLWEKREQDFASKYPEYRSVSWKNASPIAREIARREAEVRLRDLGVGA